MLSELQTGEKLVGANQVKKAVKAGRVKAVFLADDAESRITAPVIALCREYGVRVVNAESMKELGEACGISVGAAVAALL